MTISERFIIESEDTQEIRVMKMRHNTALDRWIQILQGCVLASREDEAGVMNRVACLRERLVSRGYIPIRDTVQAGLLGAA